MKLLERILTASLDLVQRNHTAHRTKTRKPFFENNRVSSSVKKHQSLPTNKQFVMQCSGSQPICFINTDFVMAPWLSLVTVSCTQLSVNTEGSLAANRP